MAELRSVGQQNTRNRSRAPYAKGSKRAFRDAHLAALLEYVPVGLLLLDWELRPLWWNREAAYACAVWNHGESRAAALRPGMQVKVPPALAEACRALAAASPRGRHGRPAAARFVSSHDQGLHAQIVLRSAAGFPGMPPAFHIELDYRRPRGDRHRPLSPGAVALLARLSPREREVAMRVREGLRTNEIAQDLRRSALTIKTQIASIFAKLGVTSRSRVAAVLNR
jgi:DNA-binding CsgD family transcriptional regulator